jgi:hypothetical protein
MQAMDEALPPVSQGGKVSMKLFEPVAVPSSHY